MTRRKGRREIWGSESGKGLCRGSKQFSTGGEKQMVFCRGAKKANGFFQAAKKPKAP